MNEPRQNNLGNDIDPETGNFRAPGFIKDFSRENSPEERSQAAQEIWEARGQRRTELTEKKTEIELIESKANELKQKVAKIDESFWAKLGILRKLADKLTRQDDLDLERLDQEITSMRESLGSSSLKNPREILKQFYVEEEKKWQSQGFEKADVEKYFNEDYLSSLNLEDYLLLISRFNTEFATHVTRQGVRDHFAASHSAGMGEFQHGFEDILKDGRLKAIFSNILMQEDKERALAEYFEWFVGQVQNHGSEDSSREIVARNIPTYKGVSAGTYSDRVAVHLGVKSVLDGFYGGEQDNEFFFLLPIAFIAKEYKFNKVGWSDVDFNNNLWVWDKEHKGVSVSTGIACIPEATPVDPRNGSKYELDENGAPIENVESVNALANVIDLAEFQDFYEEAVEELRQSNSEFALRQKFSKTLSEQFGIHDRNVQELLLSRGNTWVQQSIRSRYEYDLTPRVDTNYEFAKSHLAQNSCLYQKAKNTVPSKEYWESYFAEHPELKPNKIFYYSGEPNSAVEKLRSKFKLDKFTPDAPRGEDLFEDHKIRGNEDEANTSYEDFQILAQRVLDKYFPNQE